LIKFFCVFINSNEQCNVSCDLRTEKKAAVARRNRKEITEEIMKEEDEGTKVIGLNKKEDGALRYDRNHSFLNFI
jgi:hypothetical protein